MANDEVNKLNCKSDTPDSDAVDSLHRISSSTRQLISQCDIETFQRIFPSEVSISDIIRTVLQKYQDDGKIQSYLFYENAKRNSIGISLSNDGKSNNGKDILLYNNLGQVFVYDCSNLIAQLTQLQKNCLECIAYIELDGDNPEIIKEIYKEIGEQLSISFDEVLKELFLPQENT